MRQEEIQQELAFFAHRWVAELVSDAGKQSSLDPTDEGLSSTYTICFHAESFYTK